MPTSAALKALKKAGIRRHSISPAGGFSLVEIMIVLVIMTLVLGLAGPRVAKDMAVLHLRTTAKQFAASLRWARSQAVTTGRIYNAVFDCGGGRLIISDYAGAAEPGVRKPDRGADGLIEEEAPDEEAQDARAVLKIFELPDDIFISRVEIADVIVADPGRESIYQMTFFPDGTSAGGEIKIADKQRRSYAVAVDFLTGIVSLEEADD